MAIGSLDALGAYGRAAGISRPPAAAPASEGSVGGFGDMVSSLVGNTADALHAADKAGRAQVAGKGDLIDMVTAISAAENAMDTMVSVRDRVVSAYGEIMRMQI